MNGSPSIPMLSLMLVIGLIGSFLAWSSGSTFASVAFGLGALAVGVLILSTVRNARRDRPE